MTNFKKNNTASNNDPEAGVDINSQFSDFRNNLGNFKEELKKWEQENNRSIHNSILKLKEYQKLLSDISKEFSQNSSDQKNNEGPLSFLSLKSSDQNKILNQWKSLRNELKKSSSEYYQWEKEMQMQHLKNEQETISSVIGNLGQLNKALHGSAEFNKLLAISQASIQTYENAVLAYADGLKLGGPVVGAIEAAAAIAAGLAQVAAISSVKLPGFFEGGYTGNGSENNIAGFVHGKEYVIPNAVMQMPESKPLVESLEYLRGHGPSLSAPLGGNTNVNIDYDLLASKLAHSISKSMQAQPVIFSLKAHDEFIRKSGYKGSKTN